MWRKCFSASLPQTGKNKEAKQERHSLKEEGTHIRDRRPGFLIFLYRLHKNIVSFGSSATGGSNHTQGAFATEKHIPICDCFQRFLSRFYRCIPFLAVLAFGFSQNLSDLPPFPLFDKFGAVLCQRLSNFSPVSFAEANRIPRVPPPGIVPFNPQGLSQPGASSTAGVGALAIGRRAGDRQIYMHSTVPLSTQQDDVVPAQEYTPMQDRSFGLAASSPIYGNARSAEAASTTGQGLSGPLPSLQQTLQNQQVLRLASVGLGSTAVNKMAMIPATGNKGAAGLPESKFYRYNRERPTEELSEGIANLYDEATPLWETLWGEHLHHGFYPDGKYRPDHRQAQVDMIDEVLHWALELTPSASTLACSTDSLPPKEKTGFVPRRVLDVGCGVGGSSRHIARKFGCYVKGITLSPLQCKRAQYYSRAQGLDQLTEFEVVNALQTPYPNGSFDLIWSMESGEHMPDKDNFVNEISRLTAPNGRLIVVTWCHRNLKPNERLTRGERRLLSAINYCYYLPGWWSVEDYKKSFQKNGLVDIRTADWTPFVQHFWPAVMKSALTYRGIKGALTGGVKTFRGAVALAFMMMGYRRGLVKFQLITARKPTCTEAFINRFSSLVSKM